MLGIVRKKMKALELHILRVYLQLHFCNFFTSESYFIFHWTLLHIQMKIIGHDVFYILLLYHVPYTDFHW
jgi:hypothetical protein